MQLAGKSSAPPRINGAPISGATPGSVLFVGAGGVLAQDLPLYNVTRPPFNAVGDGVTDDRAAIQAAITAAKAAGGGTVFIPRGTYMLSQSASNAWCLDLGGANNVNIVGAGRGATVLKQVASIATSVRIFSTSSAAVEQLRIADITLDGNKASQSVNEHRHGVFLTNVTGVLLERVQSQTFTGDGLYLSVNANNVTIRDCELSGNDRNGVTLGSSATTVKILDSYFHDIAVQHIDLEPTSTNFVSDLLIQGNTFDRGSGADYVIACSGASASVLTKDVRIIGNRLNGCLRIIWTANVIVAGNNWTVTDVSKTKPCLEVYNYSTFTTILGNSFDTVVNAIMPTATSVNNQPRRIKIADNTFNMNNLASSPFAVNSQGSSDLTIENNKVYYDPVGSHPPAAIHNSFTAATDNIVVSHNLIRGTQYAIRINGSGTGDTCKRCTVIGNTIDHQGVASAAACRIEQTKITERLTLANNNIADGCALSATYTLGTYLIGGNAIGAGIYSGTGTPEAVLTAPIGSQFIRRDGGAGTTLYIKESGTGNTGWIAK